MAYCYSASRGIQMWFYFWLQLRRASSLQFASRGAQQPIWGFYFLLTVMGTVPYEVTMMGTPLWLLFKRAFRRRYVPGDVEVHNASNGGKEGAKMHLVNRAEKQMTQRTRTRICDGYSWRSWRPKKSASRSGGHCHPTDSAT